jgi:hypothetical protein
MLPQKSNVRRKRKFPKVIIWDKKRLSPKAGTIGPFRLPRGLLRRGRRLLPAKCRQSRAGAVQTAFYRSDRQVEPGGDIRHLAFLAQNLHITGRKLAKQGLILFGQWEKTLPPLPI